MTESLGLLETGIEGNLLVEEELYLQLGGWPLLLILSPHLPTPLHHLSHRLILGLRLPVTCTGQVRHEPKVLNEPQAQMAY